MLVDVDNFGNRIAQGVYEAYYCWDIKELIKNEYPFTRDDELRALMQNEPSDENRDKIMAILTDSGPRDYGMCDDPMQLLDLWPELIESDRKFVIYGRYIRGEEGQGFRPHKNGEYFGNKVDNLHDYEYLYDNPDINELFLFSIIELY